MRAILRVPTLQFPAPRTRSCPRSWWPSAATSRRCSGRRSSSTLKCRPSGRSVFGLDDVRALGADAVARARATRVKGLKTEPGWRCPLVARLNGVVLEVGAAHHRLDPAGLVVDRHQRGARPDSRPGGRRWPARRPSAGPGRASCGSSARRRTHARPVAVDELLVSQLEKYGASESGQAG